jgi:hypothetical protein
MKTNEILTCPAVCSSAEIVTRFAVFSSALRAEIVTRWNRDTFLGLLLRAEIVTRWRAPWFAPPRCARYTDENRRTKTWQENETERNRDALLGLLLNAARKSWRAEIVTRSAIVRYADENGQTQRDKRMATNDVVARPSVFSSALRAEIVTHWASLASAVLYSYNQYQISTYLQWCDNTTNANLDVGRTEMGYHAGWRGVFFWQLRSEDPAHKKSPFFVWVLN